MLNFLSLAKVVHDFISGDLSVVDLYRPERIRTSSVRSISPDRHSIPTREHKSVTPGRKQLILAPIWVFSPDLSFFTFRQIGVSVELRKGTVQFKEGLHADSKGAIIVRNGCKDRRCRTVLFEVLRIDSNSLHWRNATIIRGNDRRASTRIQGDITKDVALRVGEITLRFNRVVLDWSRINRNSLLKMICRNRCFSIGRRSGGIACILRLSNKS